MLTFFYQRLLPVIISLSLLVSTSSVVFAQDLSRIAPKKIEKEVEPAQMPEGPPVKEVKSSSPKKVILPELSGLIVLRAPEKVIKGGIQMEGILVDGYMHQSFFKEMETFLGEPLTLEILNTMLQRVVTYFRSQSTPVVDVYVPEQNITKGTIQIVVLEGRVGTIKAVGNKWFSAELLEKQIRTHPGEIIKGDQLAKDVNWINKNPFRHVDLVLSRGKQRGETDVILETKDRFPLRIYGGYENSGNEETGFDRYLLGLNWGNVFGLGHLMDYQFTTSDSYFSMNAHSFHYEMPLQRKDSIHFFGSYAKSVPEFDPNYDLDALSTELTGRYDLSLPSIKMYRHQMDLALQYKFSNSNLEFVDEPVFDKDTEILQVALGYNGSMPDDWGTTSFNFNFFYSPGDLLDDNTDEAFNQLQEGASANYTYSTLDVNRITTMPWSFTWYLTAFGQLSNGPLFGSEQLGLGGYSSVRGFREREINVDEGLLIINEIRTPNVSLSSLFGSSFPLGDLQFLGFWDIGYGSSNYDSSDYTLSSIGFGLRYRLGAYVSLRFDYGFQQQGDEIDPDDDSVGHVGLIISY